MVGPYLSSKLVVAAKLTTISTSLHISSSKLGSFTPRLSHVMSPGTKVTFSEIRVFKFAPSFSLSTLNKSFAMAYDSKVLSELSKPITKYSHR